MRRGGARRPRLGTSMSAAELAVPAVAQRDDPAPGTGAGDQGEPIRPGDAVEQPSPLARDVREHAHAELVNQVELHERPKEPNPAPDQDVPVAAVPELFDLVRRVT